ncbi:Cubilin [Orchesella cincta]|uniref:Cubilin n=1 Tax=Orchesella cincta TaxID=48709 RepID=A0A1D2N9H5_ORCCI|nr:Cubilin [Orchesella cincta]
MLMASLANFTALLEQAVAAEKAARSNLQNFVNTMKEQITGVRQAEDKCGEVMVSQTGKISYRLNNYYQNHVRCVWTVRANYRSKIKVAFNSGGLEEDYDFIAVTALIHKNEAFETEWVTKRIQPGQTNIFEGPLIFISFVSDGSIQKEGFQLEYEGMGTNINTKTIYQHYHFTDWTGQFDSANLSESLQQNNVNLEDGMSLKVTAVINPSVWSTQKLQVSIPESRLDLRPDECTTTNLAILNDFAIKSHGTSNSCCAGTCEVSSFETANRMMVGIFTSSDVSDGSQFEINWTADSSNAEVTSSDTCGGILVGDYGKIEYKVEKIYENNERCLWAIKPGTSGAIEVKLQLLQDGFEFKYDYVSLFHTISNDNGSSSMETIFLYKSGDPLRIPASLLFLEFYSDSATFGQATGFELIWEFIITERTAVPADVGYTTEGSGNEQLSCSTKDKLHFYIISPPYLDGSPVILGSDDAASSGNVSVFGSLRGSVSKLDK